MDQIAQAERTLATTAPKPSEIHAKETHKSSTIPFRARVTVFCQYFPRVLRYNFANVFEQAALFFGLSALVGIALRETITTFSYLVEGPGSNILGIILLNRFVLSFLALSAIWLVQEQFAIMAYVMRDPLTIKIPWRRISRQLKTGSSKKLIPSAPALEAAKLTQKASTTHGAVAAIESKLAEIKNDEDDDDEEEEAEVLEVLEEPAKYIPMKSRSFTAAQEDSIQTLVKRYFDPTNTDVWKRSQYLCVNDDGRAAAIRALDARKWKVDPASVLIENNLKWREKEGIDDIFSKVVPDKDVRAVRLAMGDGFFGQDRTGMPIYWSPAGLVNLSSLKEEVSLENLVLVHVQQMEYNQRVWYRELSQQQGRSIYQSTCVLDLKGFSTKTTSGGFWDCMQAVTNIDKDFYYENLYRVYILHAPIFFRFFWNTVSPLLQPETREKFIFLPNTASLHAFIDPDIIPQQFGGNYIKNDAIFNADTTETQHSKRFDQFLRDWQAKNQPHVKGA